MKKLKTFGELNEISKELIDKTSDAMISKGQHRRATRLVNTYNDTHYDLKQFKGKSIFDGEFIVNIRMSKESYGEKQHNVITLNISNNKEYNTSHSTVVYDIDNDTYMGLPHKRNISRQDVRLLGKIASIINPDTQYKKGTGNIEIGEY